MLSPIAKRSSKFKNQTFLPLCLRQAERGGAVVIKLCQWASSRPDIFGVEFCDLFKSLQDGTTPHGWDHTERLIKSAYAKQYKEGKLKIQVGEGGNEVLGSGCMAQVYKGTIVEDDGSEKAVAVKVMHPNVRDGIEHDLNIFRFLAHSLERVPYFGIGEKVKWNNLCGTVDEFARMLEPQLNLCNEARHIQTFNDNFESSPNVMFPTLIPGYDAHPDVLVENFCEGVPLQQFCKDHKGEDTLLAEMCDLMAHVMCTMIFEHNFVHGDLHPGNIFVATTDEETSDSSLKTKYKLVLLDCGIVNEYNEDDHDVIIKIIAAFIRMDGRRAAELMAADSDRRLLSSSDGTSSVKNAEEYISQIEMLSKTPRKSDFFFEKVTTYINYIFNAASEHHVKMNPSFVSMALAVKVQEGVALMLNPQGDIIKIANPIIMKAEADRIKEGGVGKLKLLVEDLWRDWRVKVEREQRAAFGKNAGAYDSDNAYAADIGLKAQRA